jgi:hypothetical protein
MGQTNEELTENLAERLCWEVTRRDDARIARRLYRKSVVDGVYRLDEGALLDAFFQFLRAIGVMVLLEDIHGTTMAPPSSVRCSPMCSTSCVMGCRRCSVSRV